MNNFEKIIGYDLIKTELLQVCDMIKNREVYAELGAKLPCGILLYGKPGLGKSLMAKCFIDECELKSFTVRKSKSENFVEYITETFNKAKENAPSIVFLDDMDKFANEDDRHSDAEEYVAVQAGIDSVKGIDVFVIATVNDMEKLPDSLKRAGRFDKSIEFYRPSYDDSVKIIKHYLESKNTSENINFDDVAKMLCSGSCAELESILNEAAIIAGYKRKRCIEIEDIAESVLKVEYGSPESYTKRSIEELKQTAYHEAGHLLMCEILYPESVGIASIRSTGWGRVGGFVKQYKEPKAGRHHILISLAGKAAVELVYGACAGGCESDIEKSYRSIEKYALESGYFGLGMINERYYNATELFRFELEAVTHSEMERCLFEAKTIISKNKDLLEKVAAAFLEKETLLASDIKKLMKSA